jgi:transcriptional regulator of acetoin/glycerol metabolism
MTIVGSETIMTAPRPHDSSPPGGATRSREDASYELSHELLKVATDVLTTTQDALSDTMSWLAVADTTGTVRYDWASSTGLKQALSRAGIETGVALREELVGKNGIGSALERRATTIVRGSEHTREDWRGLSCGASPIIHPVTRRLMGIVNVTCLAGEQNQHLRLTLNTMVTGIQSVLVRRASSRHQRLLDAHTRVQRQTSFAVLTIDAHTMILEEGLEIAFGDRETLWPLVEELAPMASELTLPNGIRLQAIPVVRGRPAEGITLLFDPSQLPAGSGDLVEDRHLGRARLGLRDRAELDVIISVLQQTRGNKSEAAAMLEISRSTLYERLKRYGIQP